jgi:uncharacterized membrane protein
MHIFSAQGYTTSTTVASFMCPKALRFAFMNPAESQILCEGCDMAREQTIERYRCLMASLAVILQGVFLSEIWSRAACSQTWPSAFGYSVETEVLIAMTALLRAQTSWHINIQVHAKTSII